MAYYLFTDHLGSTVLMASQNSAKNQLEPITGSQATYYPFGDYRGTPPTQTLTDRGFTGQKSNNQPSADLGLLYYNARYYAPGLGRFISADTIVPDPAGPQAFNRYAYTLNNPVRFTDPSGHRTCTAQQAAPGDETCNENNPNDAPPLLPLSNPVTQPCFDNQTCVYISEGIWHITMYIYAIEGDAATDPNYFGKANENITVPVCYNGSQCEDHVFPYRFLYGTEGVIQQGTGLTNDGRYIHPGVYEGSWVLRWDGTQDYFIPSDGFYFDWGQGRAVIPHISVAAGPSHSFGTNLYVPSLAHAPNGGYFVIADTGGGITNYEMDIFVGNGLVAYQNSTSAYFTPIGTWESADLEVFRVLIITPRGAQ